VGFPILVWEKERTEEAKMGADFDQRADGGKIGGRCGGGLVKN